MNYTLDSCKNINPGGLIITDNKKFEKLSRGDLDKTVIMAGHSTFTIQQLEAEIDMDSEIGKKLKSIEKELDKY